MHTIRIESNDLSSLHVNTANPHPTTTSLQGEGILKFLPSNTMSIVQPVDQGVIVLEEYSSINVT